VARAGRGVVFPPLELNSILLGLRLSRINVDILAQCQHIKAIPVTVIEYNFGITIFNKYKGVIYDLKI
jgi:hypothetical protein